MTQVLFTPHAAKRIKERVGSDKDSARAMIDAIKAMAADRDVAKHGKADDRDIHSLTQGQWRIVYMIEPDGKGGDTIFVLTVLPAKEPEGSPAELTEVLVSAGSSATTAAAL
jgi:mRNA-degrading endonuclease RelE of RelBE toxin-antitoxin system